MPEVAHVHPLLAGVVALAVLIGGAAVVAVFDELVLSSIAGRSPSGSITRPFARLVTALHRRPIPTERPDVLLGILAPAAYASVAAMAFAVVPFGEAIAIADVRTGIVLFGAAEALAIVAIFLHGWSSNSHLSLIGAYRFVALALSYELLSMFVLIAAALPAESLQVSAIVESQGELWNVVRQPLGLPLWIVVTMGVTFRGPLNLADSRDLATGTSLEVTGPRRVLWEVARGGMLTVFAAMGAAMFLGGWLGPVLPGWAWMLVKTLAIMLLVIGVSQRFGRVRADRVVPFIWTVLLPASFIGLGAAGVEALP